MQLRQVLPRAYLFARVLSDAVRKTSQENEQRAVTSAVSLASHAGSGNAAR